MSHIYRKLLVLSFSIPDPGLPWKTPSKQPLGHLSIFAFPAISLIHLVINEVFVTPRL